VRIFINLPIVSDFTIGVGFAFSFQWCHRALGNDPSNRFCGSSLYWKL